MGMKKIINVRKDEPEQKEESKVTFKKFDKSENNDEPTELTEEKIEEALKSVYDPELPVSIVDLGLIYDMQISGRNVKIKMTLTTPGCGMGNMIAQQAEHALKEVGAKNVLVDIVWDPPWNPDMMSDEAKERLGMT